MQRDQKRNDLNSTNEFVTGKELLKLQPAENFNVCETNKIKQIQYTKLNELQFVEDKTKNNWNIHAVVTEFHPPAPSHGKDFYCTVIVTDETKNEFRIRMFGPSNALPTSCTAGDILRIHKLKTSLFQDLPLHGTCLLPRLGSCVIFSPLQPDDRICVSWMSVGSLPVEEFDIKRAQELHLWWREIGHRNISLPLRPQNQQHSHSLISEEATLAIVQPNQYYTLVFKILLKTVIGMKQKLLVWDGTGDRVSSSQRDNRQENDPLTVSYYIQRLPNLPPFGCILPVVVWSHSAKYFDTECLGKWVHCTMLKASAYRNEIELNTTDRTHVQFLEENDTKVQTRLREIEKRNRKEKLPQSSSSFLSPSTTTRALNNTNTTNSSSLNQRHRNIITIVHYDHITYSTIQQVLTHPEPIGKFRLCVSVIQYMPANIKDFTLPYCRFCKLCIPREYDAANNLVCPNRTEVKMQIESNKEYETTPLTTHSTENQMSHNERIRKIQDTEARSPHVCGFVYFVRFRVKDETGEMILTVFDDDGQQFFSGIPATDLYKNNVSLAQIEERIVQLMNPQNQMDCCVKSYYVDKTRPNDRRYRIFGTELLPTSIY